MLQVEAPEIMRLLRNSPPVKCDKSRDWVDVVGSVLKISPWVKEVCLFYRYLYLHQHLIWKGSTYRVNCLQAHFGQLKQQIFHIYELFPSRQPLILITDLVSRCITLLLCNV